MKPKNFTFQELKSLIETNTQIIVKESNTGLLLFSVYGARLLGLFPLKNENNVLWVTDNIVESIQKGQWMTGGERVWVSPERSFFYENPRDFIGFHVPAGIDPGEFDITGDLCFTNRFSLLNCEKNETYDNCLTQRSFSLIDDPFQTQLPYAGVTIQESIRIPQTHLPMCAWSIAQVYTCGTNNPGTALFPIRPGGTIVPYFNQIPDSRAYVKEGYARFKIDAQSIYKLGIQPEDMIFENEVKAVYISPCPHNESWFCIIKRSNDMPRSQIECVDVARDNPSGPKGAIQSYNNGPGFSGGNNVPFGEIELQLSTGKTIGEFTISEASHQLLSYYGTKNEMLELAKHALLLNVIPEIY